MPISSIEEGLEDIRNGKMVILVNEGSPESDGFFCLPAETTSADSINHMLHHGRGVIFLALTEERIRELGILLIPQESGSFGGHFFGVPFSLRLEGVPSVSTQGRAYTIQAAVAQDTQRMDLIVPGHVQPIQAHSGGVLARSGRAEAAVDFARLAGFKPAGVICQILEDDGSVATLASLERMAEHQGLKVVSILNLIAHRLRNESLVKRVAQEE
jgi:3,4-dihydroxy 2-butanone 4-phosphate synthase/GTP cyclohydrolase II